MSMKVLLIGNHKSFMVNAIVRGLTKRNYEVIPCSYDGADLSGKQPDADAVILYMGEFDRENDAFLRLLAGLMENDGKPLYVVGNEEERNYTAGFISESLITESFNRPLDTQLLASSLDALGTSGPEEALRHSVLVIDDDGTMLRMIKTWLSVSYDVYMASSGCIALDFLKGKPVDLILLDYQMPEMDGPEVFRILKENNATAGIPVMFLTGKQDKESLDRVRAMNPVKVLMKSRPKEELMEEIDGFFAGKV